MAVFENMIDTKQRVLVVLVAVAAIVAVAATQILEPNTPANAKEAEAALAKTINDVKSRWPKLEHVTADAVAQKIGSDELLLIDARSIEEFTVSHLAGSKHVEPTTNAPEFMSRLGDQVAGKDVVFYCAVGVRSSTLATRVASQLKAKGARSVSNMAGGIFAWHNQKRPLVNADGPTTSVHSYDEWWGRMVARPNLIKNKP